MIQNPFTPEMIGKVVSVNVFDVDSENPDLVMSDSLRSYVGTLNGYTYDTNVETINDFRGTFNIGVGYPSFCYDDGNSIDVKVI